MNSKLKKILSLLVIITTITGIFPVLYIHAANPIIDGLTVSLGSGANVGYSQDMSYDGTRSLYVNTLSQTSTTNMGTQNELRVEPGTSYDIEFYIYPVRWNSGALWTSVNWVSGQRGYIISDGAGIKNTATKWTATKINEGNKAGWYKVSTNEPIEAVSGPNLFICEAKAEFYIDNLSITKSGSGAPITKLTFEKEYKPAKNLISEQVNNAQISISWRNPSDVKKICLYDVTNDILLKDNFSVTDTYCEYLSTDFEVGTEQIYRLDITYNDDVIKSQVTSCIPEGKGYNQYVGKWELVSSSDPKPPAKFEVDDTVYRTDAPSLRLFNNEEGKHISTCILRVKANSELDSTAKYRLKGYYKCTNKGYIWARPLGETGNTYRIYGNLAGVYDGYNSVQDWTEFSMDAPAASKDCYVINFTIDSGVEDLWFDDISLYQLDSGGNPTGDDLMAEVGTFDAVDEIPPELTAGDVENNINSSRIRWTADYQSQRNVAVYDYSFSKDTPVAFVPASMGYVDMENLVGGNTYEYVLKSVNSEGRESVQGVTVTAEPDPTALIIGDYKESKSGNTVTVNINIKNNSCGDDCTAQLILALYDGNILKSVSATEVTEIPQTAFSELPVTLTKSIDVSSGYSLKIYLWDSLDGMKPMKHYKTY